MVVLVLRGMMAWYMYAFINVVYCIAELETKTRLEECADEFYEMHFNIRKEIRQ